MALDKLLVLFLSISESKSLTDNFFFEAIFLNTSQNSVSIETLVA